MVDIKRTAGTPIGQRADVIADEADGPTTPVGVAEPQKTFNPQTLPWVDGDGATVSAPAGKPPPGPKAPVVPGDALTSAVAYLDSSGANLDDSLEMAREFLHLLAGDQSTQADFRKDLAKVYDTLMAQMADVYAKAAEELGDASIYLQAFDHVFENWRRSKDTAIDQAMENQIEDLKMQRQKRERIEKGDTEQAELAAQSGQAEARTGPVGGGGASATGGAAISGASVSLAVPMPPMDPEVAEVMDMGLEALAFADGSGALAPADFDGYAEAFSGHRDKVIALLREADDNDRSLQSIRRDLPV